MIESESAHQLRILSFDQPHGAVDDLCVGEIHASVVVEVIHTPVTIGVYNDVGRVAELMPAGSRHSLAAAAGVVLWRTEAGEHDDVFRRHAKRLQQFWRVDGKRFRLFHGANWRGQCNNEWPSK